MKTCKYCDTVNTDSAEKCKQCGANEFSYKCNNCGTTFDRGFCPNCGVKAGTVEKVCPKCGEKYFTAACPSCGYKPSAEEVVRVQPTVDAAQEAPKKKGTFWKVLFWIFFLPVMAIIAIWKAKKLPKLWKIIFTVIISFVTLLYYIGTVKNNEQEKEAVAPAPPAATQTVEPTVAPTAEPTAEPTVEPAATPEAEDEWEGNADAAAAMKDLLDESFPGKNKVEIDADMKAYSVCVWADGVGQAVYFAANGDETAKKAWSEMKASVPIAIEALKLAAENAGEPDAHIWYSVLNDGNTENALLIMYDGTVIYDAAA